jgi:ectoine hydroxylase-related dioxygenase (phytanoyl-CoA dioxygenase family)
MDKQIASDPTMAAARPTWLTENSVSLEACVADMTHAAKILNYPLAVEIQKNIPIYDAEFIAKQIGNRTVIAQHMAEWTHILREGPGIVVFRRAYNDLTVIDQATSVLQSIIDEERNTMGQRGDYFGRPGDNARLWNAHEKLCAASPESFARYNAIDIVSLISRAWLGPLYQITTQVNIVYPGGKAQTPHRDYHMGFQSAEKLVQYPAHVHQLSAALTLQGAVAHCDMPLESGPTKLLPYSHRYVPGYLAITRKEFRDYFEEHHVQVELKKGDAIFFNPATFHAAGTNTSKDIVRFANLMQIGSGYARSIEVVDRIRMSKLLFPKLKAMIAQLVFSERDIDHIIAACAEGYSFPVNLDVDSPLSGMAPPSQQDLMRKALAEKWDDQTFNTTMDNYVTRRHTH